MWDAAVVAVEGDGVGDDVWLVPQRHVLPQQGSGDVPVEVAAVEPRLCPLLRPRVYAGDEACCPSQQRFSHSLGRRVGGLLNVIADVTLGVPYT